MGAAAGAGRGGVGGRRGGGWGGGGEKGQNPTMFYDLNVSSSGLMEQHIQKLDKGPWPEASCVEVLRIGEVKVAVEELHMLLVVLSKRVYVAC